MFSISMLITNSTSSETWQDALIWAKSDNLIIIIIQNKCASFVLDLVSILSNFPYFTSYAAMIIQIVWFVPHTTYVPLSHRQYYYSYSCKQTNATSQNQCIKKKKIINKIHQISWRDTICKLSNLKKTFLSTWAYLCRMSVASPLQNTTD